jgi:predicted N-acetyltransferase YhbS
MNAIEVNIVDAGGLSGVRTFYETAGYGGGVSGADVTLAARRGGQLVGAVRLCTENGVLVLRGMQVAQAFQGMGIGRALLDHCVRYLDQATAYCLPYDHLARFYGSIGFDVVPPESLPASLATRLAGYLHANRPVLAMRRIPSPPVTR